MVKLIQVLNTATDIVPIKKVGEDRAVVAIPLQGEIAEHYFEQAVAVLREAGVNPSKSNTHHTYDSETGQIRGSSTNFCVVLDSKMRRDGFWLPGVSEARFLDETGKLSNNVYRDLGIAVYGDAKPNEETAQAIITQAQRGELPFILPFKAMDYALDKTRVGGIAISLAENPRGIITGDEARRVVKSMDHKGNSGACSVNRFRDGYYDAHWYWFDYSYDNGLVDWICAEGARQDILQANNDMLERTLGVEIQKMTAERDKKQEAVEQALS